MTLVLRLLLRVPLVRDVPAWLVAFGFRTARLAGPKKDEGGAVNKPVGARR